MQKLLLETEVADILRCSVAKVRRLRRTRKLPFIAGRPVTIDAADLSFYLDCMKKASSPSTDKTRQDDEIATRARQKALRQVMRKRQ